MSTFGFGGGFGASQPASPFGASTPAPFGQTPAFGQQNASPFGASSSSLFGSSTPAFGGQSSGFGGGLSSGFGTSTFGAKPSGGFGGGGGFGASPFGGSQSAFGSSSPAFGTPQSSPAFGSQPFGSQTSNPFGGGFGQSQPAFGSPSFGQSSSAFGGGGSTFGGGFGQQQTVGTKNVNYQKVGDTEGAAGSAKQNIYYCTITAMPQYQAPNEKNCAELRWEDYQNGVKGNTGQASGFGSQQSSGFGTPNPFTSNFQASTPAFGQQSTPAFGASTGGFGFSQPSFSPNTGGIFATPSSAPSFGSTPFGGGNAFASSSQFGQTSTSNPFGSFGTPQSQPFASPGFGNAFASSGGFGTPASSSGGFGTNLFSQSTPQPFQQNSAPGFNFSQNSSPGLNFGASSSSLFSGSSPSLFASSGGFGFGSSSSFNTGGNLFASSGGFGKGNLFSNPASSSSLFGGTGGLFSTPNSSGGIFGGNLFSQSSASSLFGSVTPSQQTGQIVMGNQQAPGISSSPYGTLPAAPQIGQQTGIPELRTGLSSRPPSYLSQRAVSLLSAKPVTPRPIAQQIRASASRARMRRFETSVDTVKTEPEDSISPGLKPPSGSSFFMTSKNPLQFFVRDSLPSTESLQSMNVSPSAPPLESNSENVKQPSKEPLSEKRSGKDRENGRHPPRRTSISPSPEQKQASREAQDEPRNGEIQANGSAQRKSKHPPPTLTDQEITELLPFTKEDSLHIEPSLTQLAAMARDDKESLKCVSNFKVAHKQYGSVRWLEPLDVSGLDIDSKIRISKNSVEVYLDDRRKPEIGEGLNKPAEITILGCYKMDKTTGQPTKDPKSVAQFVKRLKAASAQQNAKFIDYNPDKGIWKFQVDHFTKYGLFDSDSDEDEMTDMKSPPARISKPLRMGSPGSELAETIHTSHLVEGDDIDRMDEDEIADEGSLQENLLGGRELVIKKENQRRPDFSLPSSVFQGIELSETGWMKDALFPPVRKKQSDSIEILDDVGKDLPQQVKKRRSAEAFSSPPTNRFRPRLESKQPSVTVLRKQNEPCFNNWVKRKPELDSMPVLRQVSQAGRAYNPKPTHPSLIERSPEQISIAQNRVLVDGGVTLGASFRAGWNQGKVYTPGPVQASNLDVKDLKKSKDLLQSEARTSLLPECKNHWTTLLNEYAKRTSRKDELSPSDCPRWHLECSNKDLTEFCESLIDLNDKFKEKLVKNSVQEVCTNHQSIVWRLVSVLFSDIPLPPKVITKVEDEEEEMDSDIEHSNLLKYEWHARISHWLQEQAWNEIEGVVEKESSTWRKIGYLLSAHKIKEAALLASKDGNPRLALMIVQTSSMESSRKDVEAQLKLWHEKGHDKHIHPELLEIYKLLAGDPNPLITNLNLTWVPAFALQFWYGCKADAEISEPFNAYTASAFESDFSENIPKPTPIYSRMSGLKRQKTAPDIAFSVLQIATGVYKLDESADLSQILLPEARVPEPLNNLEGWLLLQILKSVGAIPPCLALTQLELMLAKDVISQFQILGDMEHWEIFVAMHFASSNESDILEFEDSQERKIRELLFQHAPVLIENEEKLDFVRCMEIPQTWISEAFALWAKYKGNKEGELEHLLDAENWTAAHSLLSLSLAPKWFLEKGESKAKLKQALQSLKPHLAIIEEDTSFGTVEYGASLFLRYYKLQELLDSCRADAKTLEEVSRFVGLLNSAKAIKIYQKMPHLQVLSTMSLLLVEWIGRANLEEGINLQQCVVEVQKLEILTPGIRAEMIQLSALNLSNNM